MDADFAPLPPRFHAERLHDLVALYLAESLEHGDLGALGPLRLLRDRVELLIAEHAQLVHEGDGRPWRDVAEGAGGDDIGRDGVGEGGAARAGAAGAAPPSTKADPSPKLDGRITRLIVDPEGRALKDERRRLRGQPCWLDCAMSKSLGRRDDALRSARSLG